MSKPKRSQVFKRVKLRATAEEVWDALTTAEGLVRWMSLGAKVVPGVGGSIWQSWDDGLEGSAQIDEWEPGRRLVLSREGSAPGGVVRVVDCWTLDARGSGVTLRIEQNGFPDNPAGAAWIAACARGWDHELHGLRLAVERHPGVAREVIGCQRSLDVEAAVAWEALMGPAGFAPEGELRVGDRGCLRPGEGAALRGCLHLLTPPRDLSMTLEDFDDAYFCLRLDSPGRGGSKTELQLWLSTFGVAQATQESLRADWASMLERLFPQPAS